MNTEQIADELGGLTILQTRELTKKLEETWGVSSERKAPIAAPTIVVAAPVQETFTVLISSYNAVNKVPVIKEVRAITKLGLVEAKLLVESVPKEIATDLSLSDATDMKVKLEAAGAVVIIS